jgi:NAD-specific glutamate dehydrogenase
LAAWQDRNAQTLTGLDGLVSDLRAARQMDLAMLLVAMRMLKGILA